MAFGDTVQTAQNSSGPGTSALTINFSSAVSGNLLLVAVSTPSATTWGTVPTGWTFGSSVADGSGNMSTGWYWKISTGGETSVTVNHGAVGANDGTMIELEGAFAGSPFDVAAEDESNISSTSTTQATGTTASTAQADALAVAIFGSDATTTVTDGRSYSNSFVEGSFTSTGAGRAIAWYAKKVLSATGTQTTTFTTTDTGDEMYGAIAVFKKAAAAASDVLNRGLSGIESGVIASGGGGHSGLHSIEQGFIS